MKKTWMMLIAIVMVVALVTGCGNSGSDEEKKDSEVQGSGDVKQLNLKVVIPQFGKDPTGSLIQQEWEKAMEAYLGVKLNIEWTRIPWGEYGEKTKVMLTSGEIPDIMLVTGGNDTINKYGNEGLFEDIAPSMDKMPNYKSYVDATDNAKQYVFTSDNKMYAFYDGYNNPTELQPSQYTAAYRVDVFEKNNIKIPDTIDELYDAAKQLKQLYPNSFPIGQSEQYTGYVGIFNSFHTSDGIYWNGSEYKFGPTEESFKEALQFMNKLYSEKLIDPAYWNDNFDEAKAKATTGKTFIFPQIWSGFVKDMNSNKEANVKWANAMVPNNPKYGKGWSIWNEPAGKGLSNGYGLVISAKAENKDLLIKLLDYQYADDMVSLMNWGIEGKTYQVKGDKKEYADSIMNSEDIYGELTKDCVGTTGSCRAGIVFNPQDRIAKYSGTPLMPFYHDGKVTDENFWFATAEYGKDSIAPKAPRIVFTQDESDQNANTMTPVNTYVSESIVKFIKGEMDFGGWDEFQNKIKSMGDYESVLAMYNGKVSK